jgi:hypothetical protein
MDECAADWADMLGDRVPWCCWNVLHVVFMIERRLFWVKMLPTLNTKVYKNRKHETWTFGEWLLSKGRKGMALRVCCEFGCDDEVRNILLLSFAEAVAARQ